MMRKGQMSGNMPQSQQQPTISYSSAQSGSDLSSPWDTANLLGNGNAQYNNGANFDSNNFFDTDLHMSDVKDALTPNNPMGHLPNQSPFSNQLVRMNRNNQMTVPDRTVGNHNWPDMGQANGGSWEHHDEEEDLDHKAMLARKEAQAKKKTIPPFVLKLSSFLDKERNTDLIRWSDDGNSFIVLNEDEFAKTLIPELFKHNNYASFVRQLNMYGFHKKVGLSDNSMKSSESKVKNPSEYYNKYFKRGKPDLLWLIQKPKNTAGSKRKRDDDKNKAGEEEEDKKPQAIVEAQAEDEEVVGRNTETALVSAREMNSMRHELQTVQAQQRMMSQVITRLRNQNDQLYQQARAFQTMHQQHESSINAILTFLASFYNRSIENNNNNVPDLAAMFNLQPTSSNNANHGSVVDVGDDEQERIQHVTPRRRQPLALLPAPVAAEVESPNTQRSRSTRSPSARPVSRSNGIFRPTAGRGPSKVFSPQVKTEANTPTPGATMPENDEIMSLIQNSNAASGPQDTQSPQLDFSAALNQLQQTANDGPLTQQQRNELLSRMANSPTKGSPAPFPDSNLPPSVDDVDRSKAQLDDLEKMQRETDEKVNQLTQRLNPTSRANSHLEQGFITPLDEPLQDSYSTTSFPNSNSHSHNPNDEVDINAYLDPNFFSNNTLPDPFPNDNHNIDMNLPDINFSDFGNTDNADDLFNPNGGFVDDFANDPLFGTGQGGRIESVSSGAPSPAAVGTPGSGVGNSPKRRRRKS